MTQSATQPTVGLDPAEPQEFIARLRAQGARYHNRHPFHRRMDRGLPARDARSPPGQRAVRLRAAGGLAVMKLNVAVNEEREAPMTWIKPEFEVIDLCSEVTSYLYKR